MLIYVKLYGTVTRMAILVTNSSMMSRKKRTLTAQSRTTRMLAALDEFLRVTCGESGREFLNKRQPWLLYNLTMSQPHDVTNSSMMRRKNEP